MIRFCSALLLFLAVCAAVAAPAPKAKPFETGWDKPVDPDGDCKFRREKDVLTIEVPGTDHGLGIERKLMNAPRLLRDVKGDFIVEVRVSGEFQPSSVGTNPAGFPFIGAGLLLMNGEKTYIRLERAATRPDDTYRTFTNWELRQEGQWVLRGGASVKPLEDKETYLRLERRGDKVLGSVSQDGKEWHRLTPIDVKLPETVKIGVAACNTSSKPFAPRFDRFQLKQKIEKKAAK
jgi:regulation of enolase protein 1 (concanavalin A-like superfamily)